MTRAWSGPAAAAMLALVPQARTNQKMVSWPVKRRARRAGAMARAQMRSLRKAWTPLPWAKKA